MIKPILTTPPPTSPRHAVIAMRRNVWTFGDSSFICDLAGDRPNSSKPHVDMGQALSIQREASACTRRPRPPDGHVPPLAPGCGDASGVRRRELGLDRVNIPGLVRGAIKIASPAGLLLHAHRRVICYIPRAPGVAAPLPLQGPGQASNRRQEEAGRAESVSPDKGSGSHLQHRPGPYCPCTHTSFRANQATSRGL